MVPLSLCTQDFAAAKERAERLNDPDLFDDERAGDMAKAQLRLAILDSLESLKSVRTVSPPACCLCHSLCGVL